jgi:hypothetical protein
MLMLMIGNERAADPRTSRDPHYLFAIFTSRAPRDLSLGCRTNDLGTRYAQLRVYRTGHY